MTDESAELRGERMSDRRTCENCVHFSFCSTMLKQHNNEVCEEHRKICPLPRIGSKGWGWEWHAKEQMYMSPKTGIVIQQPFGSASQQIYGLYDVIMGLDGLPTVIGKGLILLFAKTVAERAARHNWRRENRGKK